MTNRSVAVAVKQAERKITAAIKELRNNDLKHIEDRLDGIEGRLDGVEGRLSGVEGRLDGVEGRLEGVEGRLGNLESDMKEVLRRLPLPEEAA